MNWRLARRHSVAVAVTALAGLAGCASWIRYEDIKDGELRGRVVVEWAREDLFIYRKQSDPLSFKPSFMKTAIVPEDMYTDGGSIPRIFWSIPGLSPWGLGPAYIMHDWIFEVHRCNRPAPPEVTQITFEQSALILAEIGKSLIEAGLIRHNALEEIVWAVRTRYARDLWDRPGSAEECAARVGAKAQFAGTKVVDFVIPRRRR